MSAVFSPCGRYRYLLQRGAAIPLETCAIVMLNPSTADADRDDPTIRKIKGFTRDWGYRNFIVGNLYAARATDPKELKNFSDPVGPDNLSYLEFLTYHPLIVVAWGAHADQAHAFRVSQLLRTHGATLYCLGVTKDGSPRHPLYVPYETRLREWAAPT